MDASLSRPADRRRASWCRSCTFLATGQIPRALSGRLAGIFALGALQGALGWYMVSSGLADAHRRQPVPACAASGARDPDLRRAVVGGAVARSSGGAAHGALVAAGACRGSDPCIDVPADPARCALWRDLKAGAGYNTWPLMDGQLIPDGLGVMQPWYLNLFENAHDRAVQSPHGRVCAHGSQSSGTRGACGRSWLEPRSAKVLAGAVVAQAALGIWTLLAQVPLALGLAHQAGAAAVFGVAVWHLHVLRQPSNAARVMSDLVLVFDLDDTLYPEREFALSGFRAAGRWAAAELGIDGLAAEMTRLLDDGHLGKLFTHRARREAALAHAGAAGRPARGLPQPRAAARPVRGCRLGAVAFRRQGQARHDHRRHARDAGAQGGGARHRPAASRRSSTRTRSAGGSSPSRIPRATSASSGRWARAPGGSSTSATTRPRTSSCPTHGAGSA